MMHSPIWRKHPELLPDLAVVATLRDAVDTLAGYRTGGACGLTLPAAYLDRGRWRTSACVKRRSRKFKLCL